MVKFLFSVHTVTEAKQINRQGRARAVNLPARSFDLARFVIGLRSAGSLIAHLCLRDTFTYLLTYLLLKPTTTTTTTSTTTTTVFLVIDTKSPRRAR